MLAGEAAGVRQGAALLVQRPECFARLYGVAQERFIPFSSAAFPRRERPYGVLERELIERVIARDAGKPLTAGTEIPED